MIRLFIKRRPNLLILLLLWDALLHARVLCFTHQQQSATRRWSLSIPSLVEARTKSQEQAPFLSFEEHLQDRLARDDQSTIVIEGYVTANRQIGRALVFVDFVLSTGQSIGGGTLCQALLRQELYQGVDYNGHRLSLLVGSQFRVAGMASSTRNPGQAVLMIQALELIGLPRQPQHIKKILTLAKEGQMSVQEVAAAAHRPNLTEDLLSDALDLKEFSKIVLAGLPIDPNYPEIADQRKRSQKGKYDLPQVPLEWQKVPEIINDTRAHFSIANQSVSELMDNQTSPGQVTISGWVQNRRRFQDSIALLQIVDDFSSVDSDIIESSSFEVTDTRRLACLLHPTLLLPSEASVYKTILTVGSKVWMMGQFEPAKDDANTGTSTATLWITQIRLLRASWRPVTLRHILDLVYEKKFDLDEASEALLISYQEAELLSETPDATERQWKAMQISSALQIAQSRHGSTDPELLQVLDKYRPIREKFPVLETIVDSVQDDNLLINSLSGTKWQSKKQPQLVWMTNQIRTVIMSHPDYGKRTLHILDVGGGKGLLANYLGQMLTDIQIHVVDIAEGATRNGAMRAKRLNVPVDFRVVDASNSLDIDADVVVALHACGHLSDVALAHAVQRGAGFVICPCCFRSNPHLRIPITRNVVEDWLGVPSQDWNALKLLAEVQGDVLLQSQAMATICAIRANAASLKSGVHVSIKSFPIQYSTRNICIVGMVLSGI